MEPVICHESTVGSLTFREVTYQSGFGMGVHAHQNPHLFLCVGGAIEQWVEGKWTELGPLGGAYLAGGVPHANRFRGPVRTLDIVFKTEWLEQHEIQAGHAETCQIDSGFLASGLRRELSRQEGPNALVTEGLALQLLGEITETRFQPAAGWLYKARQVLHDRIGERPTLSELAIEIGVSPCHLSRSFHAKFGRTLGEYVRELRVRNAMAALSRSDWSLAEIAISFGYADQSHFCREFKAETGKTPTQFRNSASRFKSAQ